MSDLGGGGYTDETFSVCVQMSRNVVVSIAEGYSDVLDDQKIGAMYMIFCSRLGCGEGAAILEQGTIFEQGLYPGFYSCSLILINRQPVAPLFSTPILTFGSFYVCAF